MTPKERAREIYLNFYDGFQFTIDDYTAKKCAVILVNEIIESLSDSKFKVKTKDWYSNYCFGSDERAIYEESVKYYKEVIEELKKI
jgi:sugar phosphate isomerase/epimerase